MANFADKASAARRAREKREQAVLEEKALADGQLWTVMIAYKYDRAFAVVWSGRIDEGTVEAFESQHTDAFMVLEPKVILGTKLHVRQQVCQLANSDEITIRVIGAPKHEPISPGILQL